MEEKRCCICKEIKPYSEFYNNRSTKDGKGSECKECRRATQKESRRKSRMATRDKRNKYKRELRARQKETNDIKYLRGKEVQGCRAKLRTIIYNINSERVSDARVMSCCGCDKETLKNHLIESVIENGYTDFDIDNINSAQYHIDHIQPFILYTNGTINDITQLTHYTNIQILSKDENMDKSYRM